MQCIRCIILIATLLAAGLCHAQQLAIDSSLQALQQIPLKYISSIDKKVDKYSQRITGKTEKTLTKLARWEGKIKNMLEKVSPQAAEQLFGNGQQTFSSILQKIKEGQQAVEGYQQQYNQYRDKLTTDLKYLQAQKEQLDTKLIKPLAQTKQKLEVLNEKANETAALEQFIKERKKQLLQTAMQHLKSNKYLQKINKETWYYAETMRNYKELFSDQQKTEKLAKTILNAVPGFSDFVIRNSMLASLFGQPGDVASTASIAGLQTRASVQSLIQSRIAAGGADAMQQVQQNIQAAQGELNKLKDKILQSPAFDQMPGVDGSSPQGRPGGAAPNMQKTKTFMQRMEYGFNLQFAKSNSLLPTTTDIALSLGYRFTDKLIIGSGLSYKLGLGSISNIHFTHQGLGLRSYLDWKMKAQFFISGGYEMNYMPALSSVRNNPPLGDGGGAGGGGWQRSALMGISKKIGMKTKWFKSTKLSLLYDFLAERHVPVGQQWIFRVGYGL